MMDKEKNSKNEKVEDKLNSFIGKNKKLFLGIGIALVAVIIVLCVALAMVQKSTNARFDALAALEGQHGDLVAMGPSADGYADAEAAFTAAAEELAAAEYMGTGRTVTETLNDLILAIGENMKIRRFETMDGVVSTYVHAGGSVGVMVGFDVADEAKASTAEFKEMGKNVAMQVAAMSPAYLDEASVPQEVIDHEKGILASQMKEDPKMASKPEAVLAKIAEGKMGKYYKENCLVDQEFVRSDLFDGSVKGYVDSVAKALGTEIKINGFIRMTRGEGLEKRQENFAEEIAKQING